MNVLRTSARLKAARSHMTMLRNALYSAKAKVRKYERDLSISNSILREARSALGKHSSSKSSDSDRSSEQAGSVNRRSIGIAAEENSVLQEREGPESIIKQPSALTVYAGRFVSPLAVLQS